MIKVAHDSGADAVKFQAFNSDLLASHGSPLADYQKKSVRTARTQRTMLRELELKASRLRAAQGDVREDGDRFPREPL